MSKEKEPASGAPEGARRATAGAPEERRDGRGRWFGETQVCGGAPVASRGRPRNAFARTGGDRRDAVRLARAVPGGRRGELESPGSRGRERRDPAAEIAGRRSEHGQRTAARKGPSHGGRTPFSLAEAEAMSRAASPFTGRRYGVARVTREWELARSSFYHQHARAAQPERVLRRRGRPPEDVSDGRGRAWSRDR